jgi:hypothetical protein
MTTRVVASDDLLGQNPVIEALQQQHNGLLYEYSSGRGRRRVFVAIDCRRHGIGGAYG